MVISLMLSMVAINTRIWQLLMSRQNDPNPPRRNAHEVSMSLIPVTCFPVVSSDPSMVLTVHDMCLCMRLCARRIRFDAKPHDIDSTMIG